MLVAGKWTDDSQSIQTKDPKGGFVRPTSAFRNWVTQAASPARPAAAALRRKPDAIVFLSRCLARGRRGR